MKIRQHILNLIGKHSALVVLLILVIVGVFFTNNKLNEVQSNASSLGHVVADYLDGDDLKEYASTLTKDESYEETKAKLQDLKSHYEDCVYMYIFVPTQNNTAIYVYDIYTDEEYASKEIDEGDLGFIEDFSTDVVGQAVKLYETGKETGKLDIDMFNKYGCLASYYVPVYCQDGSLAAIVGIDYSFADFISFVFWMLINILLLSAIVALLMAYFEIKQIDRLFVKPIELISAKATAFATSAHDGDSSEFHIETKANSKNELDILANDMNTMMNDIDSYIKNIETITAERERIGTELALAERIQKSYLPSIFPAFPDHEEFELYAIMDPAKEVGGDFYDFFFVDEDHLALVIADVSGKGVPAALFMMISKVLLKTRAQGKESPKDVLRIVNNQLCENNEAEMFVTVWLGILELSTGKLVAANAGHEYPTICRANGEFELIKDRHGLVLAGMEGVRYREYELQLNSGDSLFLYTDGVPEATNVHNELYGTDRMLAALNQDPHADCETLLANVRQSISEFVGDADQFDDITMVGFKLK